MKYSNFIVFFLITLILLSCNKKTVNETVVKDSSSVLNSNSPKNILPEESSNNKSSENKTNFKTYCNVRFDFCIQYPDILIQKKESEKIDDAQWDGAKFVSKNGRIRMNTFGWYNDNVEMQYKMQQEGLDVTYKVFKKSFFVVTGWKKDGSGYYSKTKIIRDINGNVDHVISFEFIFPKEDKPQCAPMIEYIENHF